MSGGSKLNLYICLKCPLYLAVFYSDVFVFIVSDLLLKSGVSVLKAAASLFLMSVILFVYVSVLSSVSPRYLACCNVFAILLLACVGWNLILRDHVDRVWVLCVIG